MRIRTRLTLSAFVPLLVALVVCAVLVFSYRVETVARKNGDDVRLVRSGITELNHLIFSYITYREERPKQQFQAEQDLLTKRIAGIQVGDPEEIDLLEELGLNVQAMKDQFLKLVSISERSGSDRRDEPFKEAEERLIEQLLTRSHRADSISSRLRSLVDGDLQKAHGLSMVLIFLVLVLATVPLTFMLFYTRRLITKSLVKLRKGTEIVSSGDLEHIIHVESDDEIGELSHAFNRMTASLKEVTVSKSDLEAANRELESFSYSVSHDLRSPLRAIAGFTRMILSENGAAFDQETRRKFDVVQANAVKMGRLIDDLLRLSRLGRVELRRSRIDMESLVGEALIEVRMAEPDREVMVEVGSLPQAHGDSALIRQLLINLLSNAVKFTRGKTNGRIEVGAFEKSGEQVYYVKDNGAGFDMAYCEKLFGVFQRLVGESEFEGTGVGLAIVQRIAQRHGGRVWAEGKIEEGASFYFALPQEERK
jgi:signal transduction histidine kinase